MSRRVHASKPRDRMRAQEAWEADYRITEAFMRRRANDRRVVSPSIVKNDEPSERIRVSRSLQNARPMGRISLKLGQLQGEGVIVRRAMSQMALTVFDTEDWPTQPTIHNRSEASVRELLQEKTPGLFDGFTANISGLDLFGSEEHPFVGMTFVSDFLSVQEYAVTRALFPSLKIGREIVSHLTVAKTFSRERALSVIETLGDCLPSKVVFNGADVEVGLEKRA